MQLCDRNSCSGCMVCLNICPVRAIHCELDEEGFEYPIIDNNKCISCGKCRKFCHSLSELSTEASFNKRVYAVWSNNDDTRRQSTSGGAFSEISELFISNGGVVIGAAFYQDNVRDVRHICIESPSDLFKLRGSKYVQSRMVDIYKCVRDALDNNRKVLFSGTPCQVSALYAYLNGRFEGLLYTIDVVCHGVPSTKVWNDYLTFMEKKYSSKVTFASFRDKKHSWFVFNMKLVFENGKIYENSTFKDPYLRGFLRQLFLRPSCHSCKYASINRPGDITLADFWGFQPNENDAVDDDKGISMLMINSENGNHLFNELIQNKAVFVVERPIEQAIKGNQALRCCFEPSNERTEFWKDYHRYSFQELIDKYMYPEKTPSYAVNRYVQMNFKWMPRLGKTFLRKLFRVFDLLYK